MTTVRYSSSFVISTIVYVVIIALYFNIMDRPKPMHKPKEHRTTPPTPKIKPKPIIKQTLPPQHLIVPPKPKIKKVKHKRKIHKKRKVIKQHKQKFKLKHKIKKAIKHKKVKKTPKIIPQPIKIEETPIPIQKEIIRRPQPIEIEETSIPIQEEIITRTQPIEIEETSIPIQEEIITRTQPVEIEETSIPIQEQAITRAEPIQRVLPQQPKGNLNARKREFLKGIRAKIYANKRYPARARRRHIQGRVHVVFDILPDGEATNIRIDNSPRILKKEVRRSMRKSFPINIPPSLASMFPMRNISVNIDFELE